MTAAPAPGPGLRSRLLRATPYLLLIPGLLWLFIFFVLPTVQMFTYSVSSGTITTGFKVTWTLQNYADAFSHYGKQFLNSILYGGLVDDPDPAHRVPGGLHHRLPRRALQEPAAVHGHRPVLHQLPHPDAQLEDPAG